MEALESVLLETARPVDAAAIARALGPLVGTRPPDAARAARYCAGLALEAVPAELAERAVAALAAEGVGARRVPAERIAPLPRAEAVTAVEWEVERATLHLASGPVEIAFAALDLVLAHALERDPGGRRERERQRRREESRQPRGVGAEAPVRRLERDPEALLAGEDAGLSEAAKRLIGAIARRRREETLEASLALDLVTGGRLIRVRREEVGRVRSAGLDGAAPHSMEVFLSLARAALAGAPPAATRAPENAALVEAGLLEPALFHHADELARYERWLLAGRSP